MKKFNIILLVIGLIAVVALSGCSLLSSQRSSSDTKQAAATEKLMNEAVAQVGLPNIKNFREMKLVKDIQELRDQEGLITYTYLFSEFSGKLTYFGQTIGYGIPYATQLTNPMKIGASHTQGGYITLPQAEPNGLFSPESAEGTWVLMKDPTNNEVLPVYIEARIVVSPFRLSTASSDQ